MSYFIMPAAYHYRQRTKKPNKYHAVKTMADNIEFDSKREANFYKQLKLQELVGNVIKIERQVKYVLFEGLKINKKSVIRPCAYILDFKVTYKDGAVKHFDAKGMRLPSSILKIKWMYDKYKIIVELV